MPRLTNFSSTLPDPVPVEIEPIKAEDLEREYLKADKLLREKQAVSQSTNSFVKRIQAMFRRWKRWWQRRQAQKKADRISKAGVQTNSANTELKEVPERPVKKKRKRPANKNSNGNGGPNRPSQNQAAHGSGGARGQSRAQQAQNGADQGGSTPGHNSRKFSQHPQKGATRPEQRSEVSGKQQQQQQPDQDAAKKRKRRRRRSSQGTAGNSPETSNQNAS